MVGTETLIQHGLASPKNPHGFLSCSNAERPDHVISSGETRSEAIANLVSLPAIGVVGDQLFVTSSGASLAIELGAVGGEIIADIGVYPKGQRRTDSMHAAAYASSGRSLHFR